MTNEEAIKVLEQIRQWTDYPKEALTMAIEALSKPELPTNLDEAAEDFTKRQGIELAPFARKFFKAGAKWMVEQLNVIKE